MSRSCFPRGAIREEASALVQSTGSLVYIPAIRSLVSSRIPTTQPPFNWPIEAVLPLIRIQKNSIKRPFLSDRGGHEIPSMTRLYGAPSENRNPGTLTIEHKDNGYCVEDCCYCCFEVFYVPSKDRLEESGIALNSPEEQRVKIVEIEPYAEWVTIFPIHMGTNPNSFLKPKYDHIEQISIHLWKETGPLPEDWVDSDFEMPEHLSLSEDEVVDYLASLPKGFIKQFDYGLGLTKRYKLIIETVQELSDCTRILVAPYIQTGVSETGSTFNICLDDFNEMRKSIDRTLKHGRTAANEINYADTRNILNKSSGQPPIPVNTGRSPLHKSITGVATGGVSMSQDKLDETINSLTKNAKSIAEKDPKKVATLKRDLEFVELEALIERYAKMLVANHNEKKWQTFLDENSFLLNLAFGCPVVKVCGQTSVGGRRFRGDGGKVADFLVKNNLTNNSAIVEIKTPKTKLLNKSPYRPGVFTPSGDLVGAVNQSLNQKHHFEREFANHKVNSGMSDIEAHSVRCCVIIGTIPEDLHQQKSFELYRGNSKNVDIITFDELLKNLEALRDLISPESPENTESPRIDPPF